MSLNDGIEYAGFRLFTGTLGGLPDRWARTAGRRAGLLAGRLLTRRRDLVAAQLAAVLPELGPAGRRRVAREVFAHLGETVAETFCVAPERLAAHVRVVPGWEVLDEALAAGRGALAVTGHLGNFELGGRVLAARYPLLDVVKPMRNPLFDRHLTRLRSRHGIATVPMDRSGRAVLAHLRRGGLVSLLVDQDAGRDGLRTDFLGRPASTWPGAARLALRTGAPVVPVAIRRESGGGHVLEIGPPVEPPPADAADAVPEMTRRVSAAVEAFIRACPEQWFWVHRRWKGADEAHV